jgi:hypothetical protein
MITNKDIYDLDSINKFKTKFGKLADNKTTVSSYWSKNHDNNIKKINTVINWQFISNSNIKKALFKQEKTILYNSQFRFNSFEQELMNIFVFDPNESILIVSHYEILVKILERCISKKFNRNKTNIEVSSIWKIEIDYTYTSTNTYINTNENKHTNEYIKYLTFEKIYPIPDNYSPLEYVDNKYRFSYKNGKCILFNSGNIPEEYLIYLYNKTLPTNIRNRLTKINNRLKINSSQTDNKELKFTIDNFK